MWRCRAEGRAVSGGEYGDSRERGGKLGCGHSERLSGRIMCIWDGSGSGVAAVVGIHEYQTSRTVSSAVVVLVAVCWMCDVIPLADGRDASCSGPATTDMGCSTGLGHVPCSCTVRRCRTMCHVFLLDVRGSMLSAPACTVSSTSKQMIPCSFPE